MEFIYEFENMKIKFIYSAKDFGAKYESPFGEMNYGLHLMYMCPWKYSEEMLREKHCRNVAEEFKKAEKLLSENSQLVEEKKLELDKKLEEFKLKKEDQLKLRREKKMKFKEGQISEIEYQLARREVKNIDFEIWKFKSDFFREFKKQTGIDLNVLKEFREAGEK